MNSRLYIGEVTHTRWRPIRRDFTCRVFTFAIDLAELETLSRVISGFGYNRFRPWAIHDRDYLDDGSEPIREKLMRHLRRNGCGDGIARIELITSARWMHYAFNPVSFYYAYRKDGSLRSAAAEVNNTFRDRHIYVLDAAETAPHTWPARCTRPKAFHVSPFNPMGGEYDFALSELGKDMSISINLRRDGAPVMSTGISGRLRPLSTAQLAYSVAQFPLGVFMTMPRILWEAGKLHLRHKLPVFTRPVPGDPMTIRQREDRKEEQALRRRA